MVLHIEHFNQTQPEILLDVLRSIKADFCIATGSQKAHRKQADQPIRSSANSDYCKMDINTLHDSADDQLLTQFVIYLGRGQLSLLLYFQTVFIQALNCQVVSIICQVMPEFRLFHLYSVLCRQARYL